jgi:hypothetical protein
MASSGQSPTQAAGGRRWLKSRKNKRKKRKRANLKKLGLAPQISLPEKKTHGLKILNISFVGFQLITTRVQKSNERHILFHHFFTLITHVVACQGLKNLVNSRVKVALYGAQLAWKVAAETGAM